MAFARFLLALALAGVAQLAAVRLLPPLAAGVDLLLLVAVLQARHGAAVPAMFAGALCGLATDALLGSPLGLFGFADTAVAFAVATFAQRLAVERSSGLLLLATLAGALQQALLAALVLLLLSGGELAPPLAMAAKAISTGLLALAWVRGAAALTQRRAARRARRQAAMRF